MKKLISKSEYDKKFKNVILFSHFKIALFFLLCLLLFPIKIFFIFFLEKKIDYNDIIHRIGYFRTQANLSARETSLRLGYSEQFMKRIENKSVELKVRTLLDFFDIVDITPQDFFYMGEHYNKEDKNVLDLYNNLSLESKQTILDLMKKLK